MRIARIANVVLATSLLCAQPVKAKAYHPTIAENIGNADYIAIVNLGEPADKQVQGGHWTYAKESHAELVENIKGQLPKTFKINSRESFTCAQCSFEPGQSLVFLKKDGVLYAGSGWSLASLPIRNGMVKWPSEPNSRTADGDVDLHLVIQQIKSALKTAK